MLFRRWRAIPAQLAAHRSILTTILKELREMRASTQHLTDAVAALAAAVNSGANEIAELVAKIQAPDSDDATVEAAAARIGELTGNMKTAVDAAHQAVATVPVGPVGDQPAPSKPADPAPDPNAPPAS